MKFLRMQSFSYLLTSSKIKLCFHVAFGCFPGRKAGSVGEGRGGEGGVITLCCHLYTRISPNFSEPQSSSLQNGDTLSRLMHAKCLAQWLVQHQQLLSVYYYYCNRVTATRPEVGCRRGLRGRD